MAINGKQRQSNGFDSLKVGFAVGSVVAINPDKEELIELLGITDEESISKMKEPEYVTEKDGIDNLRLSFFIKEKSTGKIFNKSFFISNTPRTNKDGNNYQYINTLGATTWARDEENLLEWFKKTEYRQALRGEEALYNFLKIWTNIDTKDPDSDLSLDNKKMFNGNFREIQSVVGSGVDVIMTLVVRCTEKEGEMKEYQNVYDVFLPGYMEKQVMSTNFTEELIESWKEKGNSTVNNKKVYLRGLEALVVGMEDEQYGCKDFYSFEPMRDYIPGEHLAAQGQGSPVVDDSGNDY